MGNFLCKPLNVYIFLSLSSDYKLDNKVMILIHSTTTETEQSMHGALGGSIFYKPIFANIISQKA